MEMPTALAERGGFYLRDVAKRLGHDPDDGQAHAGEQRQLPRLAHHEEDEENQTARVPHDQTQFLAQCLAHRVGVRGDV